MRVSDGLLFVLLIGYLIFNFLPELIDLNAHSLFKLCLDHLIIIILIYYHIMVFLLQVIQDEVPLVVGVGAMVLLSNLSSHQVLYLLLEEGFAFPNLLCLNSEFLDNELDQEIF